jgi:uncharacterized protein YaeQ
MNLRCELNVNGENRKLLICQGPNELPEHLSLKLAAYLMFWKHDPLLDASAKNPALAQFDFMPDVLCLDDAGDIKLWVECGSTTMNKLNKLTKRVPVSRGRIVVLKTQEREARRLRDDVNSQLDKPQRIEILAWPGTTFKDWLAAVGERTEVFGEADETSLNAVVNEKPFAVQLVKL